jgi:hypothetical protein
VPGLERLAADLVSIVLRFRQPAEFDVALFVRPGTARFVDCELVALYLHDGVGEFMRCFLGQVVADPTFNGPV